MELVQDIYIKILSPFARINNERNRAFRYVLIGILFFVFFWLTFAAQMNGRLLKDPAYEGLLFLKDLRNGGYGQLAVISSVFMLVIVFLTAERPLKRADWNFYFVTTWFLFNLMVIIAGISHNIGEGYLLTQIAIMILIPALSITLDGRDGIAGFFDVFAWAAIAFFAVLSVINMIWFPFGQISEVSFSVLSPYDPRYLGIIHHPNRLAEYATMALLSCMYLIIRKRAVPVIILAAVTAGLCISQEFLSVCRISLLAAIIIIIGMIIFCIRGKKSGKVFAAALVIMIASSVLSYSAITRQQDPLDLTAGIQKQITVIAAANDDADDQKDSEDINVIFGRLFKSGDMNQVSSGRIGLWKMCFSKLTWNGNDVTYVYPMRVLNAEGTGYTYFSMMHNVILEFSMRCGWVTGLILLGIELWTVIFCIGVVFGRKKRITDARIFAVFGIAAFLMFGNVEPINEAFFRVLLLVYYLSIIPVFTFASDYQGFKKGAVFLKNKTSGKDHDSAL